MDAGSADGTLAGSINLDGGPSAGASGGNIETYGNQAGGGRIRTFGGAGASAIGGNILTYGGSQAGGNIDTSDGGGDIDTRVGYIELGQVGDRGTIRKNPFNFALNYVLQPFNGALVADIGIESSGLLIIGSGNNSLRLAAQNSSNAFISIPEPANVSGEFALVENILSISGIAGATSGQALKYDGDYWIPAEDASGAGGGGSDHGSLTGLEDDDHTQYFLNNPLSDVRNYCSGDTVDRILFTFRASDQGSVTGEFNWGEFRTPSDNLLMSLGTSSGSTDDYIYFGDEIRSSGQFVQYGPMFLESNITMRYRRAINFSEDSSNGSNVVQLRGPESLSSNLVFNLPDSAGTSGQILATDAASANTSLIWIDQPAGITDHGALGGLGDDDHTQYLLADGSRSLTGDWDAGSFGITAETFTSDVAGGTAPFTVTSTTLVNNLNADLLDGNEASDFATTSHTHNASDITGGTLADARVAESNVTQHQAALSITESQISDLNHAISSLSDVGDVTITSIAAKPP